MMKIMSIFLLKLKNGFGQQPVKVCHLIFRHLILPKSCFQPMKEEYLLSGYLEPTNEPYAVAKIAGIKLCESFNRQYGTNYRSVMPSNLYGPRDNFHLQSSHILPAVIRKFLLAKLELNKDWDGIQKDEAAHGHIPGNIEASFLVKNILNYRGDVFWDTTKPDGMPLKLLDISRLSTLGRRPKIELESGIRQTYEWYKRQV